MTGIWRVVSGIGLRYFPGKPAISLGHRRKSGGIGGEGGFSNRPVTRLRIPLPTGILCALRAGRASAEVKGR